MYCFLRKQHFSIIGNGNDNKRLCCLNVQFWFSIFYENLLLSKYTVNIMFYKYTQTSIQYLVFAVEIEMELNRLKERKNTLKRCTVQRSEHLCISSVPFYPFTILVVWLRRLTHADAVDAGGASTQLVPFLFANCLLFSLPFSVQPFSLPFVLLLLFLLIINLSNLPACTHCYLNLLMPRSVSAIRGIDQQQLVGRKVRHCIDVCDTIYGSDGGAVVFGFAGTQRLIHNQTIHHWR